MAADVRVPLDLLLDAFGVPAVVTRPAPDQTPIATVGIWVQPLLDEVRVGADFQATAPRKVLTLSKAAVPTLPRGSVIRAAEQLGDPVRTWRVDGFELVDADSWRAIVVPG